MAKELILSDDTLLMNGLISELFKIIEVFLVEFSMLANCLLLVDDILCELIMCKLTFTNLVLYQINLRFHYFRPTERWSNLNEISSSVETIDKHPFINDYRDWPELFLVPSDYCKLLNGE